MNVPARCDGCGCRIEPTDARFQYVGGWCAEPKKGPVKVVPTRWEQRFACIACVGRMERSGAEWSQPSLFDN